MSVRVRDRLNTSAFTCPLLIVCCIVCSSVPALRCLLIGSLLVPLAHGSKGRACADAACWAFVSSLPYHHLHLLPSAPPPLPQEVEALVRDNLKIQLDNLCQVGAYTWHLLCVF